MKKFESFEKYSEWTEKFDECHDYETVPVLIDDGWKFMADMFTECKSYKTAIRRFVKTFKDVQDIGYWGESMEDSCEFGYFKDTSWNGAWQDQDEQIKIATTFGSFSWGIEEVDEGRWYIFLNASGAYAGREEKIA